MLTSREIDSAVAEGIRRGNPDCIDKGPDGGLKCPIQGHEHQSLLPWTDGDYEQGTSPDEEHRVNFRVSPTFIYADPLDNFIAGQDLIRQAIGGEWGKAETGRLGYENSEDALSWNVFRSLQESETLRPVVDSLTGFETDGEPDLILWGRRILDESSKPCLELDKALEQLEPAHRQRTEPDVVLHWPGQGWLFIEAKFNSPNTTYAKTPGRVDEWLNRYAVTCPGVFDMQAINDADPKVFPEQLLRNIAVASKVISGEEKARVISLVPKSKAVDIEPTVRQFLPATPPVSFGESTWEDLYDVLPDDPSLSPLRDYMETKTAGMRKAFDIRSTV